MSEAIIERAYLIVDDEEFECKSISPKFSHPDHKVVKVMNRRNRGAGHTFGVPDFTCSAEIPLPQSGHELNFIEMMLDKDEFTVVIEYEDGTSVSIYDAVIKDVDQPSKPGEDTVTTVEMEGLDIGFN